jgi:tetratricopeptide (TPR) repeat protein
VQNELGILYAQTKDFKKSERHYLQAIQLSPGWELPQSNLSALYNQQKNSPKARIYAQNAIKMNPTYALAYINLGTSWMNVQDFLTSLECFQNARNLDHMHYVPDYKLAELNLETENYAGAEEHFFQVDLKLRGLEDFLTPLMQFPVEAIINMDLLDDRRRNESPKKELIRKIEVNPRDTASLYELGMLYKKEKEPEKAEEMFLRVIQLNSNYQQVNYEYGSMAMEKQEYEKAEILLRKALSNNNSNQYTINLQLAKIYEFWRDFERAELHYKSGIQLSDKIFEPYYNLYDFYIKQKKYKDAEKILLNTQTLFPSESNHHLSTFYETMMNLFPNDGQWPYKAATRYLNRTDKKDGLRNIENDDSSTPDDRIMFFQNHYSFNKKTLSQCLNLFQKAYDLEPEPKIKRSIREKMSTLIVSSKKETDHEIARKYIEEVLRTDSTSVASLKNYLAIHEALYGYNQALEYLKWLKEQSSISFSERLLLCRYTIYKGDYESALSMLQEARKISPFDEQKIKELLAMTYRLSLQNDKAEKLLLEIKSQSKVAGEINYTLARLMGKQNNKKSASRYLTSAFQNGFQYNHILKYDPVWKDLWSETEWVEFLRQNNITLPRTEG